MSVDAIRKAVETKDHAALVATLADDVTFHRPATLRLVSGKEQVSELFGVLLRVLEDFRYVSEVAGADLDPAGDGALHGLVFHATVSGEPVQGIDLIRFDEHGKVIDFAVMMRPLSGVLAIADAVTAQLVATGSSIK